MHYVLEHWPWALFYGARRARRDIAWQILSFSYRQTNPDVATVVAKLSADVKYDRLPRSPK